MRRLETCAPRCYGLEELPVLKRGRRGVGCTLEAHAAAGAMESVPLLVGHLPVGLQRMLYDEAPLFVVVALVLAEMSDETGACRVRMKQMLEILRDRGRSANRSTLNRAISRLERGGWVRVERVRGGAEPSVYRIHCELKYTRRASPSPPKRGGARSASSSLSPSKPAHEPHASQPLCSPLAGVYAPAED